MISETSDVAGDFISWARDQLKYNEKLREDFGILLHEQKSRNEVDNDKEFVTLTNTKVEAKGIGTQVRGLRHGSKGFSFTFWMIWRVKKIPRQLI